MSCSINAKNLSISKEGKILHQNINLHLGHKEKVAIIGANGMGKSTLLECIAGLHFPIIGELELFHHQIKKANDMQHIRQNIGYLLQNSDDHFLALKVEDDIAFTLLANGVDKQKAKKQVFALMESLDISHLAGKIVYHLSGGEKRLVALAGVLVYHPQMLLLDEPSIELDWLKQKLVIKYLQNLQTSMLIISHDEEFVKQIVSKIYRLDENGLNLIKK